MGKRIIFVLLVLVVQKQINCFAQSNIFYTENVKRIEEFINGPLKMYNCENGVLFPAKYEGGKIRSDLSIMTFINGLFNSNSNRYQMKKALVKVRKKAMNIETSINGLIESDDITILGKYIRANVKFDFINNILTRSKVTLRTTTHGTCEYYGHLPDFKIIRDYFIKDSRMLFDVGYDEIGSDTIYTDNLIFLAGKFSDYKFNIPDSSTEKWINGIYEKQYQSDSAEVYKYHSPPESFKKLISEGKLKEIKSLLFSPNYIISVNAMEAILYLANMKKVELTPEIANKINQIKEAPFIILQLGAPDVLYKRRGYKELKMTDEMIIRKYSSSM